MDTFGPWGLGCGVLEPEFNSAPFWGFFGPFESDLARFSTLSSGWPSSLGLRVWEFRFRVEACSRSHSFKVQKCAMRMLLGQVEAETPRV